MEIYDELLVIKKESFKHMLNHMFWHGIACKDCNDETKKQMKDDKIRNLCCNSIDEKEIIILPIRVNIDKRE